MSYGKSKNILVVVGGMAAGVAAMYLLDPSAGRRRRAAIASAADHAVHHTGDAIHSAGDAVRDAAVSAGEKIGDMAARARRAGERATRAAASIAPATATTALGMRRLVDSYHDSAHYLADHLDRLRSAMEPATADRAHHALHAGQALLAPTMMRAKSAVSRIAHTARRPRNLPTRSRVLVPVSLSGIVCLAAGAGAMYLFDPECGRGRRRYIREELARAVRKVGRFAHRRGRNVRSHVEGVAREIGLAAPHISSRDYISGEQLLLRVRSEIARISQTPRMIQVMTDSFGKVTLTGQIIGFEHERVLMAVRETHGVRCVIDRLRVQSTPDATEAAPQRAS